MFKKILPDNDIVSRVVWEALAFDDKTRNVSIVEA